MGSFFKDLLGGTDDSAQKRQLKQNERARQLIEKNTQQAREDVLKLFPAGDVARNQGLQRAIDVNAGTFGRQSGAIRSASAKAQNQLLRGLPQIQNAILGQDVNLGGLRAQALTPEFGFLRAQLPQFQGANEVLGQSPGAAPADLAQILAGLNLPNL